MVIYPVTRIARETKLPVTVGSAEDMGLDPDGGECAWYTVCDTHSTCIGHRTKSLAIYHSSNPTGWCEECMA